MTKELLVTISLFASFTSFMGYLVVANGNRVLELFEAIFFFFGIAFGILCFISLLLNKKEDLKK